MEPKLQGIKEEVSEREQPPQLPSPAPSKAGSRSSPPAPGQDAPRQTRPTKGSPRDAPDSPEGAQQPPSAVPAPASSSSSSSGGSNKGSPPAPSMGVLNGSAGRGFPSPPGSLNGGGSGDSPSPPGPQHSTTPATQVAVSGSVSSSPALLLEARQLAKMRRFLTTIVQFGADVSADTGDRVRTLVLALVSNSLGVEEFQRALQATFNFPLRPFVLPFLRAGIPALQREVAALARHAKQSPQQYLRQHEQLVLDPSFSPSEPSEIFHSLGELHPDSATQSTTAVKRPRDSFYENGLGDADYGPAPKRYHYSNTHGSGPHSSSGSGLFSGPAHHPLLLHHASQPGGHHAEFAPAPAHAAPASSLLGPHQPAPHYAYHGPSAAQPPHNGEDSSSRRYGDDEWKNIHVMLNCILSMVEKTKRALAILQHRPASSQASEPMAGDFLSGPSSASNSAALWLRRIPPEGAEQHDIKKTAGEIMAQTIKATEDRVAEVRRRAEEAVNEVKRQAVMELQRAVTAAESKAAELVAAERSRMEKLLLEARKHASAVSAAGCLEDAPPAPATSQHAEGSESCWNCGRKANETCSGCNMARYCGAFCQHKDWENHHQVCNNTREKNSSSTGGGAVPLSSRTSSSRSGTPGPATSTVPTPVSTTPSGETK